jgi:uncharacterized DUF497 family protein
VRVEWDRKKDRLNVGKHGVRVREAKELFISKVEFLELYDGEHSELAGTVHRHRSHPSRARPRRLHGAQ